MAKEVQFKIRLSVDGKERLVSATTDVQALSGAFEEAKKASEDVVSSLFKFNQGMESVRNLVSGLRQVTGVLRDLASAAGEAEVVEAKLANNMRNTMGAREADIESVKRLIAAQKELGVVDDDIQMAGAQELSTYLEKRKSLETLIPVMNDMIVQQYGLNATQEEGANIAMMLGKVMEGQTGGLSRLGYYFDEAQEKILKFGEEEERAAVLADIVGSTVGGSNESVAKTAAGMAKKVEMSFDDMRKSIGGLLLPVSGLLSVFDGLGGVIETVGQLSFGLMGVTSAVTRFGSATKLLAATQKAWGVVTVSVTALTRALGAAMTGAAVGATTLKMAMRGLMIATGVGAAVAGLTFVIEKLTGSTKTAGAELDEFKDQAEEVDSELRTARSTLALNIAELENLIAAKKTGKDVSAEEKKTVSALNDTYGQTMGYFQSVEGWYKALCANSEAYCRQMVVEARTRRLANQMAELEEKRDNINKVSKTMATVAGVGEEDEIREQHHGYGLGKTTYKTVKGRRSLAEGLGLGAVEDEIESKKREMSDLVKAAGSIEMKVKGSTTRNEGKTTGAATGKTTATEKVLVAEARTYKDLTNNVAYYVQELERCDIRDTERLKTLARQKKAAEDAVSAFKELTEALDVPADPQTLEEYDKVLQQLRKDRQSASAEAIAGIDAEIARTEAAKAALEDAGDGGDGDGGW